MPSLSTAEGQVRQRNLLFFTSPALWPIHPVLPLVRRRPGQEEEYGLLYDLKGAFGLLGYSATVWRCNVFLLPSTLEGFLALPKETYDTPEEIFDAGWRVDG